MFTLLSIGLTLAYAANQLRFLRHWIALSGGPRGEPGRALRSTWSIIIAARNEAQCIAATLERVLSGTRGLAEIIVVDDHSTDATCDVVAGFSESVDLLRLPEHATGKKAALTFGVTRSRGEWIATVDADTEVGVDWLSALDAVTVGQVAVAGPVLLEPHHNLLTRFQALDFCGMMAITAASLRMGRYAMGNGANLAFAKTAFDTVGGYDAEGRESASGDDIVLLGKLLRRFPGRVAFAKTRDAVVRTAPKPTLRGFVQQRWRWSAKTGLNAQPELTVTLGAVWVFHVLLFVGLVLAVVGWFSWGLLATMWATKLLVDYLLLRSATRFFRKENLLGVDYPLQSLLHAAYVAGIGTLALLPLDYEWKGRRHRV